MNCRYFPILRTLEEKYVITSEHRDRHGKKSSQDTISKEGGRGGLDKELRI